MKILPAWIRRLVPLGALIAVGPVEAPAAVFRPDIVYGRAGGVALRLNASVPDGTGPFPVAILVHGGGWSAGDKAGSNHPGDGADISPWFPMLDAAHFTWFSINYRLAPRWRWPACLDDVNTAIRWVKGHAAEFKGDPRRMVLFGHSAGGHLVCYAAVCSTPATRVQAVVAFAPVTDLVADSDRRGGLSRSLQWLFDLPKPLTPEAQVILRRASPIDHVEPGLPPFLLLQGTADRTVPFAMTQAFAAKLRSANDPCELIPIPGAPHALLAWGKLDPGYPKRVVAWLRRTLGNAPR